MTIKTRGSPRDELPERADWTVLFQLKQKWQVSLAALLMRARTVGRMSENNYLTAIKAASARGWRRSSQYRWEDRSTQPA